jgi:hypothetical protein
MMKINIQYLKTKIRNFCFVEVISVDRKIIDFSIPLNNIIYGKIWH